MAEDDFYGEERSSSGLLILVAGVALLLALGAIAWCYFLQGRLATTERKLAQAQSRNAQIRADEAATSRDLRAATEAFGAKVGITQQQIELRARDIVRQEQADNSRLAQRIGQQAAQTQQQVSTVSRAVSNVQSDVGGVKRDVANNRQELASTEQQLHAAIGDLGVQSGLIAKNAAQLNYLKELGQRSYFEFTLRKGQAAQIVSTIKLRLRKADVKHSRYTIQIFSDDRRFEKKNRDLDEPLQFYSGKPPMLFEIVVNRIEKNLISGYLSTPKNAPKPVFP